MELGETPGLTIGEGAVPDVATPISATEAGGIAVFTVRDKPRKIGDGWEVSDPDQETVIARVQLAGEAGAYGGQDMRSRAETWFLARGATYAVPVVRLWRPRSRTTLPVITLPVIYATGRPMRVW
jgi:hypothetical protein